MIVGVAVVAWAAPLIRLAEEAPPVSIAFWRTLIASFVLVPLAIFQRDDKFSKARGHLLALFASALFLTLHFTSWIASVNLTTVAASVLLVTSTPVWVGLVSALFLRERFGARGWIGVAAAVCGAAIVAAGGISLYSTAVLGNSLALAGALAASGYLIIGRSIRPRLSLLTYVGVVYAMSSLMLFAIALATGIDLIGFSTKTWLAILGLGVGPQLIGHTIFNFLLGELPAGKVAVILMGEPIGSALIAGFLFGEIPGGFIIPGGVLLLAGIALTVTSKVRVGDIPSVG
jgi:drug/metabolite transporter (DMT)-like permease